MSLTGIEDLERAWRDNGILKAVEGALDKVGFDDRYVTAAIEAGAESARSKVIKDGTWGMVEVDASHLRLLDCPILQRLRTIHQLGFSFLTYPSAEHSRFSHSLGVFGVVSRFLREVRRRPVTGESPAAPYKPWVPSDSQVLLAEHAAILHDIGHMPFSHVIEQILNAHPSIFRCGPVSVDDFIFDPEFLLEKNKVAELLSVAIVLTPRFQKFYCQHVMPGSNADAPHRIAGLILGLPPEPSLAGIANLISGSAIDADKIDYINRDAAACGIETGIDVSRLFMRSSFLTVQPSELQRLKSLPHPPVSPEVIFVVNASGLDSIEEVGQARTMLYHRVYLHQTTRNAERLLAKALLACLKTPGHELVDALNLWTMDDFGLLRILSAEADQETATLAARIRFRQLPKRAGAFGRRFVKMSFPIQSVFPKMQSKDIKKLSKQIVGNGLEALRSRKLRGQVLDELERKIADEAALLAGLLCSIGATKLEGRPLISVLPMPSIEENRIDCIILDNEQLTLTSSSSVSDEQMEASDIMKSTGYVLTDPAWRDIVFLAARTVLYRSFREEHEVEIEPYPGKAVIVRGVSRLLLDAEAISQRVRMSGSQMARIIADATRAGYFVDKPRLAPVEQKRQVIQDAADHLREFMGQGTWSVNADSISAFILQFPPRLRTEVLQLISSFNVLGRTIFASAIASGIRGIPLEGDQKGFIAALSPDSGSNVRMIAEHELTDGLPNGWSFVKSIREVFEFAKRGDTLVLCDDNVTSGSQAICQMKAWLGVEKANWTEQEMSEQGIEDVAFSDRDKSVFLQLDLKLVVANGSADANTNLMSGFSMLGISRFKGLSFVQSIADTPRKLSPELEQFLSGVGTSLISWCRYGEEDPSVLDDLKLENCKSDALGYSGARALMCTPLNVPTGTLTPFWAPGYFNGEPWMPLLIRRGYLKKLILS